MKLRIGVEIEVNDSYPLEDSIDLGLWSTKSEHCGVELISTPISGLRGMRQLYRSISHMNKVSGGLCGYIDAGTHIHIDFMADKLSRRRSDLVRRQSVRGLDGKWENPLGSTKKYYWVDPKTNKYYHSQPEYLNEYCAPSDSPSYVFSSTEHRGVLLSVKRFMALGIRFADVLFAMMPPTRRFNKYCHTIAEWDENTLMRQNSIRGICSHPNLLQNHRRTMFNPLSFKKFGTVEVRMCPATLDPQLFWAYVTLFSKMALFASERNPLPEPTGIFSMDFTLLANAIGLGTRHKITLMREMSVHSRIKNFNVRCYACHGNYPSSDVFDYGLSRSWCVNCHERVYCAWCGQAEDRRGVSYKRKLDDAILGGRFLCNSCDKNWKNTLIKNEEKLSCKYAPLKPEWNHGGTNTPVGSGFDSRGFTTLDRFRTLFG